MTLLLDTHAALWLAQGEPMSTFAKDEIESSRTGGSVLLSAVSVWEIWALIAKGRIVLDQPLSSWVRRFTRARRFETVSLTVPIAVEAAGLPPGLRDPADRFLVATASHLDVPLVTRDKRILDLAESGYVKAIKC